jgi:phosphoserine phosphatase RsbU/P
MQYDGESGSVAELGSRRTSLDVINASLEIKDGQGRRVVRLEKAIFTIGRRKESDLCVSGANVSRDHAEIQCKDDRFVLRDRTSRFGTFVNGQPVTEHVLSHGDKIRLGQVGSDGADAVFLIKTDEAETGEAVAASAPVDHLRQVAALLEGLQSLSSGHVLDDVLALVLDAAIEMTGAERGFIMLANAEGRLEFTRARGTGRVTLSGKTFNTSHVIPEQVFSTGRTEIVSDLLDSGQAGNHFGTIALGIRHVLCSPLRLVQYVHEQGTAPIAKRIGVLYLDSRIKGSLLSPTTRAAIETLAREAAVAIENARLYREALEKARLDQELTVAAEIQRNLLPAGGHVGSTFEIIGKSLPCRAIGGDFFDHLELPSGRFAFALGDVAGKGPPAALVTAALQALFTAHAGVEEEPGLTLARINRALVRRAVQNRFATMAYGLLSNDGRLTYSNAGHNPPMLFHRGGVRRLEQGGLVLGMFPEADYPEETVHMEPGDVLLIFSDGVSEAIDTAGEEFGDDRIIACLQQHLHLAPSAILEKLLGAVAKFSAGTEQRDDITALVLRYTGA